MRLRFYGGDPQWGVPSDAHPRVRDGVIYRYGLTWAPDYSRPPRYLCVCQCGHSRSVALARVLHARRRQAVACGWQTAGDGLAHLVAWADVVCVLQSHFAEHIPAEQRPKVVALDVGHDLWSNPYHPELLAILERMVKEARL